MNERGGDANGRGAVPEKTSEPPPSKVEALDGSNYEEWSGRMRSAFKRYKLLKIAVGEEKMPEEGEARDDVKPVLDKIKDTYARMAAAGSSVSQLQQCTKIISVLDNSWDNLIPTLNSQQDQWTPEWLRQQILQEDFRRRHVGGGAATKTAEGYGAAGRGRGRGGWKGRGRGGAVSWRSKKQNEVGLSSCETEYMALHHGAKEVVWLRRLLEELGVGQEKPTVVFCDNESAVKLAKNACLHGLTKHIRPKWHWVRRLLDKEVRLEIVKTHQQQQIFSLSVWRRRIIGRA
ncbi:hypothetical protein CLOM_g764 [Closterium sp. NIES-68]|nr:hypothetical protein CLOM_g764 [Closterium sp. NIES-68]